MRLIRATERRRPIPSLRPFLVVAVIISAMVVVAPTASASSRKAFHLAKNCDTFPTCIVTASNYKKIPVGTEITYSPASVPPSRLLPTVHGRHGTTSGTCDLTAINAGTGPGRCVFSSGTGSLTSFTASLSVTFDGRLWYWDGTYGHGGG
jgi:hypothetical protein